MSRSSEGVRQCAACRTATASGGVVEAFDLGGVDAEGSMVERCIVFAEVSMLPGVARVLTGFGEVAGMRQLSMVV